MYLEIFPADFAVFRVFLGISRDFAEIPEFRGSATARNIKSPASDMCIPGGDTINTDSHPRNNKEISSLAKGNVVDIM